MVGFPASGFAPETSKVTGGLGMGVANHRFGKCPGGPESSVCTKALKAFGADSDEGVRTMGRHLGCKN